MKKKLEINSNVSCVKSYSSNRNAITLIALVITIILLLILSGVVINFVMNGNIFNKAELATNKYLSEQEKEQIELDKIINKIDGGSNLPENTKDIDAGTEVKLPENWLTETLAYVSTENGKIVKEAKKVASVYAVSTGDGETVPVPNGFYYVGGKINQGVVISDNEVDRFEAGIDKTSHEYATKLKGNQFVWIPCKLEDYKKIDWQKEKKRKVGYRNKSIRI